LCESEALFPNYFEVDFVTFNTGSWKYQTLYVFISSYLASYLIVFVVVNSPVLCYVANEPLPYSLTHLLTYLLTYLLTTVRVHRRVLPKVAFSLQTTLPVEGRRWLQW